jgi:adenylate cyclase
MSLHANLLERRVKEILRAPWQTRQGRVVPSPGTVMLMGGAVDIDAAVLYADLARSSHLASEFDERVGAKVVKSFLACTSHLISHHHGKVTSFDGDRVMGVFVGPDKETSAAMCGLEINWAVSQVILPHVGAQFQSLRTANYLMSHAVGIDTGRVFAVRVGYREANDLVWIGRAPNLAAKLSDVRSSQHFTFATREVLARCANSALVWGDPPEIMWSEFSFEWLDETIPIFASGWWLRP